MLLSSQSTKELIKKIIAKNDVESMKIICSGINDPLTILPLIKFIDEEKLENIQGWMECLFCVLLKDENKSKINLYNSEILLYYSVKLGNISYVEYLLKNGADINGYSILPLASKQGNIKMVKYLVEENKYQLADVHINNESPLVEALSNGHIEIIKYLISKGCVANERNDTLIWNAIKKGFPDVGKYLIEKKSAKETLDRLLKILDQLENDV